MGIVLLELTPQLEAFLEGCGQSILSQDPTPGRRLTDAEYPFIFDRVPRFCVDIVVRNKDGVLFFEREIEPFKGKWTLPGGVMKMGETLDQTHERILKGEFGPDVCCTHKQVIGVCNHYPDGPGRHSVSVLYETEISGGKIAGSSQGHKIRYISDFADKDGIQPYHRQWFSDHPEFVKK